MNNFNQIDIMQPNPYLDFYREQFKKNHILNRISQALSISIYQYSRQKQTQNTYIQRQGCIQILDESNQIQNNFSGKKQYADNVNQNMDQDKKVISKKSQSYEESPEKEHSYTILIQTGNKNFSSVKNQKKLMQVQDGNIDFIQISNKRLDRQQILSRKEKLQLRKFQFTKLPSKKRKYHGVGPQKRQLKSLF